MLQRFKEIIIEKRLFQPEQKILLAVSGGMDSVLLVELFHLSSFKFGIAHCNFNLRQEESVEDEKFVKSLAKKYNVAFHVKHFDTSNYAADNKISIQMAARDLRYQWFNEILLEFNYSYVATAHHANDVLETVLLNLTRGSGIAGFHGIDIQSGNLIRPLLFANKNDISEYLKFNKIPYREDSSNASNKYYRNLIRNEVIPLLQKINPNIVNTISQTAEKVGAVEKFFIEKIEIIEKSITKNIAKSIYIDINQLQKEKELKIVLFHILKKYQFNWQTVQNIVESLSGTSGQIFFSETHEIIKDRSNLIISAIENHPNENLKIEAFYSNVSSRYIDFKIYKENKEKTFNPDLNSNIACLDYDQLEFPLILRNWEEGDYFKPLGMKGNKKISDYLIDVKLPIVNKRQQLVLCSGETIVWLVKHRIHNNFKVTENTKMLYIVEAVAK